MKKTVRLGLAQINCTVGDLEGNSEKIISYIQKGREKGVDIISFPEMAITGYPPDDLLLKPGFIRDNMEALNLVARQCTDITAIVGFVDATKAPSPGKGEARGRLAYNAAAVIHNGKIKVVSHKIILPNYGVFDERRYFIAGSKCLVFELDDIIFGVNICEDIWHAEGPTGIQALKGKADLIININASPFHAGKHKERAHVLARRVAESGVAIAYTNLVGGQDELVFDGGSMIFDSSGKIVAGAPLFEEALLVADINLEKEAKQVDRNKGIDEELTISSSLLQGTLKPKKELLEPPLSKELKPLEEIYKALILGTRDYVLKSGFKKTIIGLSGGIDSALTAIIAVDALGADKVLGVAMPSRYSSQGSIDDARLIASNLGIEFSIISIEDIFKTFLSSLEPAFEGYEADVTEENLQARIRGTLLMALSNKFGSMVITTGNKSEMGVGYSTLYGDMAGGFSVLKDVPKTLVYELAELRNEMEGFDIIPRNSITKPPSAELRHEQVDQDSLPPYDVLDTILQEYIENELSINEIVALGYEKATVSQVLKMVDSNEYKRRQAAPGVKITPKAFGRDRRMPIVNKFRR
ncbi:MAG: NAD+ synthase [Proteobacteria bacterium]|nr:NAD+ synthase [Pseudomonadota bacterium]